MKWHVFRPLGVAIGLIVVILIGRVFMVPDDFGVHGESFTYNFHRLSNEQEWKDFPVKYQGREYCADCHRRNVRVLDRSSAHAAVECENCHGPGAGHPDEIEKLPIDRSREQCLRCHALLEYPENGRSVVPGIVDRMHMRRKDCAECHNPHDPREES
jgi:hypothetical protein